MHRSPCLHFPTLIQSAQSCQSFLRSSPESATPQLRKLQQVPVPQGNGIIMPVWVPAALLLFTLSHMHPLGAMFHASQSPSLYCPFHTMSLHSSQPNPTYPSRPSPDNLESFVIPSKKISPHSKHRLGLSTDVTFSERPPCLPKQK